MRPYGQYCPISRAADLLGDRWSLLIIRDIVFDGKKTYGEFLKSEEGIATNVLASRLAFLEAQGIISRTPSPEDRRKDYCALSEKGLDLIPIMLNIVVWSAKHDSRSNARRSKAFLARLSRNPTQVSEEVKALVRKGGCIFPKR